MEYGHGEAVYKFNGADPRRYALSTKRFIGDR
jgi:hypothetical protein